jgi:hypothetical protein
MLLRLFAEFVRVQIKGAGFTFRVSPNLIGGHMDVAGHVIDDTLNQETGTHPNS